MGYLSMTWNHLVFFFNVLWLSAYRSLITLVKFIPWYFCCNFKQVFYFLLTFYDLSLLVYRNSTDFCILIGYSAALLSSFNSFCVETLQFPTDCDLIYRQAQFPCLLPIWTPVSFSHLSAVPSISNTALNRSAQSRPSLAPLLFDFLRQFRQTLWGLL